MTIKSDNADVESLFVQFRPGMRKRIVAAVEALIALLDEIDCDPDFEDGYER